MNERQRQIAQVIADQMCMDVSAITPEKGIVADLGADSLDSIELVMELEDEFAILIEDERAEKVVTVADAFALVEELLSAATTPNTTN